MTTLLFELGVEEIPSRYQQDIQQQLIARIPIVFSQMQLPYESAVIWHSPRRFACLIYGVAAQQEPQPTTRIGPFVAQAFVDGQPTKAALGFAQSCGVAIDSIEKFMSDKGERLAFTQQAQGQTAATVIPALMNKIWQFEMQQTMRWNASKARFIRPVRWAVCLFGAQVIEFDIFGVRSSNHSYGHRFHAPAALPIVSADTYAEQLLSVHVMVDQQQRQQTISQQIAAINLQLAPIQIVQDDALLAEIIGLVEWPQAIIGKFADRYLQLPKEVLVETLRQHQKFFHAIDSNRIANTFCTIANIASHDVQQVILGNQRVLTPRLDDALFFYNQDCQTGITAMAKDLADVEFAQRLGSMEQRCQRIEDISTNIAVALGIAADDVRQAATLCKADLNSAMVGEFAKLQGVMGKYYALQIGVSQHVADAIEQHYLPRFANDTLPTTLTSSIVALADKLDQIMSLFAIGKQPTSQSDPYALRRCAIGALRILTEQCIDIDIHALLNQHAALFVSVCTQQPSELAEQVYLFMFERLKVALNERFPSDHVQAMTVALGYNWSGAIAALQAIVSLAQDHDFSTLVSANKRVKNIIRAAEKNIDCSQLAAVQKKYITTQEEVTLWQTIALIEHSVEATIHPIELLKTLNTPLADFFANVMVMDTNIAVRDNRLALLLRVHALLIQDCDLSLIDTRQA